MAAGLKKGQSKTRYFNWYIVDMLLMVEKGIRGEICDFIYRYAKANSKYVIKIMIKIKNCHLFNIGMWIIYMDGQCRKSFQ